MGTLPSWFFMFIDTELRCALEAYSLLTAFRDRRISLARMEHAAFSPFLAESFNWRFVFSSSLCIAANKVTVYSFNIVGTSLRVNEILIAQIFVVVIIYTIHFRNKLTCTYFNLACVFLRTHNFTISFNVNLFLYLEFYFKI